MKPPSPRVTLIAIAAFLIGVILIIVGQCTSSSTTTTNQGESDTGNMELDACQINLSTIDKAVLQYSDDSNGNYPTAISDLVPKYLESIPVEPSGGTYFLDTNDRIPRAACSLGHSY
jgi:hypothetical protein